MSAASDFHQLPDDLPVPEDDGAADHLPGATIPSLTLDTTDGQRVDLATVASEGTLALYVYPQTGMPGRPVPAGWNQIPGARGCTPQSCAFRDSASELADLGATVLGLREPDREGLLPRLPAPGKRRRRDRVAARGQLGTSRAK